MGCYPNLAVDTVRARPDSDLCCRIHLHLGSRETVVQISTKTTTKTLSTYLTNFSLKVYQGGCRFANNFSFVIYIRRIFDHRGSTSKATLSIKSMYMFQRTVISRRQMYLFIPRNSSLEIPITLRVFDAPRGPYTGWFSTVSSIFVVLNNRNEGCY